MMVVAGRLVYKGEAKDASPEQPLGERTEKYQDIEERFWWKLSLIHI